MRDSLISKHGPAVAVVVAVALAVALGPSRAMAQDSVKVSAPATPSHPDITGHWKLNKDKSDATSGAGERGGSGRGPGMGGGMKPGMGGGMGGPGGPGGNGPGGQGPRGGGMGGGLDEIKITQTDSTVTIMGKDGQGRVLYTDGRLIHIQRDSSMSVDMRAYWNGSAELVVEHVNSDRGNAKEFYSVSTDGSKLTVVFRTALGVERTRVYNIEL